jgi:hypothetical protein
VTWLPAITPVLLRIDRDSGRVVAVEEGDWPEFRSAVRDGAIDAVYRQATQLTSLLGNDLDIEFAIVEGNRVAVLQSRPISAIARSKGS